MSATPNTSPAGNQSNNRWRRLILVLGVASLPVLSFFLGRQSVPRVPVEIGVGTAALTAEQTAGVLVLPKDLRPFVRLLSALDTDVLGALATIEANWHDAHAVMVLEASKFTKHPGVGQLCLAILRRRTGQTFGSDANEWYAWIWRTNPGTHPDYALFKAALYQLVDPRFRQYFDPKPPSTIRLDEIRWGGVRRDGIPPLQKPKMISVEEATYLEDDNVVFGIEINGDARAYPKRILAWHEMFRDTVGGRSVNGVYCTLCGSMILYDTVVDGVHHELGTSGFLYRSNKLMYDHATKSLWSTLAGRPVVGALVGKQIELERLHVVTTTWSEWRKRHPQTLVLSLETGHRRDYGEGVAYRDYFSHDDLMFTVPHTDLRLKNKDEVLALQWRDSPGEQLAISADFLKENLIHHDSLGGLAFVVLTDLSGANRVYESGGLRFTAWDGDRTVQDEKQNSWQLEEAALVNGDGRRLERLPAHRAFWFGWHGAYPKTRLVK